MNQFTIPQFIDVEDKIFGPITTRQFGIILAAVGPILITYKLADTALFIVLTAIIGGSALILAFVKINGQPFHYFLLNIFTSIKRPSRRIWYRDFSDAELRAAIKEPVKVEEEKMERKSVSNVRIRDLSLLVNTGGYYKSE